MEVGQGPNWDCSAEEKKKKAAEAPPQIPCNGQCFGAFECIRVRRIVSSGM
jgi:hypothetical protein